MTLIVALSCKDGIVMASDGQLTLQSSGGPIKRPAKKIKQIGNSILWAGSGDLGFIQKIEKRLASLSEEAKKKSLEELRSIVVETIYAIRKGYLDLCRSLFGEAKAEKRAPYADLIFAEYRKRSPLVLHITTNATEEELQDFGYATSGIGDTFAHTLLLGRDMEEFSCEEGKVLAYKVIREAIDVGAYGLGEPIDIWTISEVKEDDEDVPEVNRIEREEIQAISDVYLTIKQAELEIFKKQFL